jgi:hypothetical protein
MNIHSVCCKVLRFAWFTTVVGAAASAATVSLSGQTCSPTPAEAVRSGSSSLPISATASGIGYRVAALRWDPLLRQKWALIASCGHPERPLIAVPVPTHDRAPLLQADSDPAITNSPRPLLPVVHAGDLVHLRSQEATFRIELAGIAQESAATGQRVRVRILRSDLADGGPPQTVSGVVRGLRDVEIER